jgi:hypothetical protein
VLALGRVVATPAALVLLQRANQSPMYYLARHAHGDDGESLCAEDKKANRDALRFNSRVLSSYQVKVHDVQEILWVITDAGHQDPGGSVTTLLLPGDY